MASGLIYGIQTKAKLSHTQMMKIAKARFSGKNPLRPSLVKEFALAIIWAEGAYQLAQTAEELKDIELFLNKVRMEHNNNWRSPIGDHSCLCVILNFSKVSGNRGTLPNEEFFLRRIQFSPEVESGLDLRAAEDQFHASEPAGAPPLQGYHLNDFYTLCRGGTLPHSCNIHNPTCYLTTNNKGYFILAPVRVEPLCPSPKLMIFHDILTKKEMDFMKAKVLKDLTAASVQDHSVKDGAGRKVSTERTQSSGWMWDQQYELLYKISKKTGLFTDLIASSPEWQVPYKIFEAEAWQMGLYGSGGHYLPHYDAFDKVLLPPDVWADNLWVGNRCIPSFS